MTDYRKAYGLPDRYFLSLGRMVEKKNLATLVSAYARYAEGVAVAGERLKVKGNDGEKQGAGPPARRPYPPAWKPYGLEAGSERSMEQRANLTENCELNTEHCAPALVFVGSGELENALKEQARGLGLRVIDRSGWKVNGREEAQEGGGGPGGVASPPQAEEAGAGEQKGFSREKAQEGDAGNRENGRPARLYSDVTGETPVPPGQAVDRSSETRDSFAYGPSSQIPVPATRHEKNCGTVFFYGFRQIEENPVFYALAEAFVLPSLKEEWGLVVNEAMAAGLPVIVSRTAGCAEDLVPKAPASRSSQCSVSVGLKHQACLEDSAGSVQSGEDAGSLNPQRSTLNSLEERSNGFVFDPSSVDALSEALRRIADPLNPQLSTLNAAAMGRRSREIVAQFSCENFARQAMRAACAARGGGCESYR